jgi:catalase
VCDRRGSVPAESTGGVTLSDGSLQPGHHKIDGAPSVLFDAVVLLPSEEGILSLLKLPPARDFVSDAYAHYKFIAFTGPATKLFAKIGLPEDLDDGFVALRTGADVGKFIEVCRDLRFWDRPDGV